MAPPIYGSYNSSGNSSTTSSGGSYLQSSNNSASATSAESFVDQLKRSASSVNPKNRQAQFIRKSELFVCEKIVIYDREIFSHQI